MMPANALASTAVAQTRRGQINPTPVLMIQYELLKRGREKITFLATSDTRASDKAFDLLGVAKGWRNRNPRTFKAAGGVKVTRVSNGQQIYPPVVAN